jgi:hypothetical protein
MNRGPQILKHLLGERIEPRSPGQPFAPSAGISVENRPLRKPDALLETLQSSYSFIALGKKASPQLFGNHRREPGIPKIEEARRPPRLAKSALKDLELEHAPARVLCDPRLSQDQRKRDPRGSPAIPLAQQPNEDLAPLDLLKPLSKIPRLARRLSGIDDSDLDSLTLQPCAKLWKGKSFQDGAFAVHVSRSGG